ncbi:helix-turn-helix domain-containing protein [Sphingobacterium lactis]|uniref:Uncharacterized protein n=1 Tax=Sphingobacterium lactis TaxID=797291 RepID=A0A1H6CRB3_9SPHI|nr:hypothetical protein [Sphingobacterium lactis]SEG75560.1 hypothetical protein SAMN05421877_11926 [Sphingobacterium lactis]
MARVTKEQTDLIVKLLSTNKTFADIARETKVSPMTVARYAEKISKGMPLKDLSRQTKRLQFIEQIAKERLTLTRIELAKKYGKDPSYLSKLLIGHPLEKDFKQSDYRKRGSSCVPKATPKPLPKAKEKKDKEQSLEVMQKGHVKLQKGEKIFETKQPKAMRSVPMYDNKNTIKFVELDDPRSNEEIRSAWKEEQEKKLRSLAS